jgi:ribonuclease Z
LHSRLINPLIPPTRSSHVPSPIAQDTNLINMNWSTSVYTTLSSDTEPSIVITFDSAKYIFNAGENTSRAILQNARGWRKVKALFLTRLGTQRSSGVPGVSLDSSLCILLIPYVPFFAVLGPGLLMSVADSSPRVMDVVGPKGLLHFLASMRFYVFRFVRRMYSPTLPKLNSISRT